MAAALIFLKSFKKTPKEMGKTSDKHNSSE